MRRTSQACIAVFAAAGLAAAMTGCADLARASRLQPAGVNVESPAAGAVLAAQARATPYPSFRDVPPKVADVPSNPAYASAVGQLNAERAEFRAWQAANPAEASDTAGYAEAARNGVIQGGQVAPSADQAAQSADWAKRMRDSAQAPPPVPAPKP